LNPETTVSLLVGVAFLVVMTVIYFVKERKPAKVSVKEEVEDEELD